MTIPFNNAEAYQIWAMAHDVDQWWIAENAADILDGFAWFDTVTETLLDLPLVALD